MLYIFIYLREKKKKKKKRKKKKQLVQSKLDANSWKYLLLRTLCLKSSSCYVTTYEKGLLGSMTGKHTKPFIG